MNQFSLIINSRMLWSKKSYLACAFIVSRVDILKYAQRTEFENRFVNIHTSFSHRFRSTVVITSASHAEGRRFEPGRKHSFLFRLLTAVAFYWYRVSISLWNVSYGIFCFKGIIVSRLWTWVSCNIAHIDALQRTKAEYWYQPVKRKRLFENPGHLTSRVALVDRNTPTRNFNMKVSAGLKAWRKYWTYYWKRIA